MPLPWLTFNALISGSSGRASAINRERGEGGSARAISCSSGELASTPFRPNTTHTHTHTHTHTRTHTLTYTHTHTHTCRVYWVSSPRSPAASASPFLPRPPPPPAPPPRRPAAPPRYRQPTPRGTRGTCPGASRARTCPAPPRGTAF